MERFSENHRAVQAITGLVHRYADLVDAGDFAGLGRLFADGAVATEDGTVVAAGAEAVEALFTATTRRYPDGTPRTTHQVTNLTVAVGRDTATARSRFVVLQATDGLPLQPVITGAYHDRFARTDGAWTFAERRMAPHLLGDLSHHLLIDPPPTTRSEP